MRGKCRPVPGCVNYSAFETQIAPERSLRGVQSRWRDGLPRRPGGFGILWLLLGALFLIGCAPAPPPHPRVDGLGAGFSERLARAHLDALAGLGPRWPDSRADVVARAYLEREFRLAGARTTVWRDGVRRHPVATLAGESSDRILLVAAYPVLEADGWIDDSGVALLLELARVFGRQSPPYTLEFALAEIRPPSSAQGPGAEAARREASDRVWEPVRSFSGARHQVRAGGRSLARAAEDRGPIGRFRAVIAFDWTAHAGLRIARDLRSQPVFRQIFWDAAADLGQTAVFPSDGRWASPESLHLGFRERSMDRVLALVDEAAAGANPAVVRPPVTISNRVLEAMGGVTIEALNRLMRRFQKVDAFSNGAEGI